MEAIDQLQSGSGTRPHSAGLAEIVWSLQPALDRHGLIFGGYDVLTPVGHEP